MTLPPPYSIITLPKPFPEDITDTILNQLAQNFRSLRLEALKTNPEAFGSTYETEVERPLDQTLERLRNFKATHFITVRSSNGKDITQFPVAPQVPEEVIVRKDLEMLVTSQWVGMLVLLGPQEAAVASSSDGEADEEETGRHLPSVTSDPFARMTAYKAKVESNNESYSTDDAKHKTRRLDYHINATFVSATARRAGLGAALMQLAVEVARSEGRRRSCDVRVGIAVNRENIGARDLYLRAGFEVVGEEQYTQLPRLIDGEMRQLEMMAYKMECDIPFEA